MRLTLNQACVPALTTPAFIEVAQRAGITSVELRPIDHGEGVEVVERAVRESGIRVEAIDALMDWVEPDFPDPDRHLHELAELAVAVSAPLIVCVSPLYADGAVPPDITDGARDRLAELAASVRSMEVALALEPVGWSSTRPGMRGAIATVADAISLAVGAGPDVLLAVDSCNLATAGEPFARVEEIPVARIGIAHLADWSSELRARVGPGVGSLDLVAFVRALISTGYTGALSLEYFPSSIPEEPATFIRQAMQCVRTIVEEAAERPSLFPPS